MSFYPEQFVSSGENAISLEVGRVEKGIIDRYIGNYGIPENVGGRGVGVGGILEGTKERTKRAWLCFNHRRLWCCYLWAVNLSIACHLATGRNLLMLKTVPSKMLFPF